MSVLAYAESNVAVPTIEFEFGELSIREKTVVEVRTDRLLKPEQTFLIVEYLRTACGHALGRLLKSICIRGCNGQFILEFIDPVTGRTRMYDFVLGYVNGRNPVEEGGSGGRIDTASTTNAGLNV
jgi:hypothetical protein